MQNRPKESIVIGLGPTSLRLIVELLSAARNSPLEFRLTVFEKREDPFMRYQRLIDLKTNAVENEETWEQYCSNLFDLDNAVYKNGALVNKNNQKIESVNARQKFIRKLKRQSAATYSRQISIKNFSIRSLQKALYEHIKNNNIENVKIEFHFGASVQEISLTKKIVIAKLADQSVKEYDFDDLIICEGVKREIVEIINESIKKEKLSIEPFQFKKFPYELPKYHVAVSLTMQIPATESNTGDYIRTCRSSFLSQQDAINKLELLGWQSPHETVSFPIFIIDKNLYKLELDIKKWQPHIFIASEIPESIASMDNLEERYKEIVEWVKVLAAYHTGIPEDHFIVDTKRRSKDYLTSVVFQSHTQYVTNPVMPLPNNGYAVLLGDCNADPVHALGWSSNKGSGESKVAVQCIVKRANLPDKFAPFLEVYTKYCKQIHEMLYQLSPYRYKYLYESPESLFGKIHSQTNKANFKQEPERIHCSLK